MTHVDDFQFAQFCRSRLQDECGRNARNVVKRRFTGAETLGRRVAICIVSLIMLAHIPRQSSCTLLSAFLVTVT